VNRRGWLLHAVGAAGIGRAVQDTSQQAGAADPLRDPSIAGMRRAVVTPLDNDEAIKAIERQLKCTCGCNLDIFTCRTTDFTCTYSPALHKEVVDLYSEGKTAEEIVGAFVREHGEAILLKPRAEGFNVLGYVLPGALVLLVAGVIGFVLLRRHRNQLLATTPVGRPTGPASDLTTEEAERLERALSELQS
jgi:cytochrome c-type biogenesis protein CcmH